jgi:hypothetical protein
METPESSSKLPQQSLMSWEGWQRLMGDARFHLLRQVLQGFRWQQMEMLAAADSERASERIRGRIDMLNIILTGGLDDAARNLLGLPSFVPEPPADYMAHLTWSDQDTQGDKE